MVRSAWPEVLEQHLEQFFDDLRRARTRGSSRSGWRPNASAGKLQGEGMSAAEPEDELLQIRRQRMATDQLLCVGVGQRPDRQLGEKPAPAGSRAPGDVRAVAGPR